MERGVQQMEANMRIVLLFFLFTLWSLIPLQAQQVFEYQDTDAGTYIGTYFGVKNDTGYTYSESEVFNFGNATGPVYLRTRIVNQSNHQKVLLHITNPIIDTVVAHITYSGKPADTIRFFQSTLNNREYHHQNFIIPVRIRPGESAQVEVMVKSSTPLVLPISISDQEAILRDLSKRDMISGIYFGIMIIMLLYNLFIYFTVRDKSYLYYVAYIFWVCITQAVLHGYANRYLWPGSNWLSLHMVSITGAIVGMFTIFFVKSFLHTREQAPKLHPYLNLIIAGDLIGMLFGIFEKQSISYQIVDATAGLGSFFVIFMAARLYLKGSRAAGFFLLSWSVFLGSVIVFVLKNYGILPFNLFTLHSMQFGSAIEAGLLSFALADRINIYRKEKEAAQLDALNRAMENERIVTEQNVILETKVKERTVELQVSNTELSKTLKELTETQTQLVEQEKMASLGQLTAGIAHEINNPINFVSSNVKPLKRDVEMLIDYLNQVESIAVQSLDPSQKKEQILQLKTDLDFSYLIEEINYLLKGISEGSVRTAEIVKGLRLFSRVDEDDIKIADINEGIESTLIITNNLLNGKIIIDKQFGQIPSVECYPGKLNQVFLNLISNGIYAIKQRHGEQKGGQLIISTRFQEDNVIVEFKDNGTGIKPDDLNKLFDPFFTTKPVGEGTGLGLSIVYNTIKKHNGTIQVTSNLGEGSTFTITLPVRQP